MVVFQRSASSGSLAPLKQCDMCPVAKQSAAVNNQHMINCQREFMFCMLQQPHTEQ